MNHSFYLNEQDEERFQKILAQEKGTKTEVIKKRLFQRREREPIQLAVIDYQFVSILDNRIAALLDSYQRGKNVEEEISDLKKLVETKLKDL